MKTIATSDAKLFLPYRKRLFLPFVDILLLGRDGCLKLGCTLQSLTTLQIMPDYINQIHNVRSQYFRWLLECFKKLIVRLPSLT